MRFHDTGSDGHTFKIRGTTESVSAMSYRKATSSGFTECFGIGEGYMRLKNTATASLPSSPDEGAFLYDSTVQLPKVYDGSSWLPLPTDSTGFGMEADTWTPVLWDNSSSDAEGQTYTEQKGFYLRIGRMVFYQGRLIVNSLGSLTTGQAARIGGLPYAASQEYLGLQSAVYIGFADSLNITAGHVVAGYINDGTQYITLTLWDATAGTTPFLISELSAGADIVFSGHYIV